MTTPPYPHPDPYAAPPPPMNPADEKTWAVLIHVGSLFFPLLAPLIGYLVLRDRGPFVRAHAATALNFQLTMIIAALVGGLLAIVLVGFVILFGVAILAFVLPIIAAVQAGRGQWFTYPLSIPFVR